QWIGLERSEFRNLGNLLALLDAFFESFAQIDQRAIAGAGLGVHLRQIEMKFRTLFDGALEHQRSKRAVMLKDVGIEVERALVVFSGLLVIAAAKIGGAQIRI